MRIEGGFGGGHRALPERLPWARLVALDGGGHVTRVIATITDTSPDVVAYDRPHNVYSPVGLKYACKDSERAEIQVFGEAGEHATPGTLALHRVALKVFSLSDEQRRSL